MMAETLPTLDTTNASLLITRLKKYGIDGKLSDLQDVLGLIKHINEGVRKTATHAASNIIRENLINRYHDLDPAVREKLGILLESLDPRVIDDISSDLYCDTKERRLRAIQILGLLKKNPRIRDILVNLVKDHDEKIRATAINLLGKVVGPNDQELILSLLNDNDKRVRANTIEALENLGNKRMIPVLLRFRRDGNNRIKANILKALYNLGYKEIESDLLEMLASPSDFMKASALWVITQIKIITRKIEDATGYTYLSENEMVLRNARNALSALRTPRAKGYLEYLDLSVSLSG
jgi:HEAT repeat protein